MSLSMETELVTAGLYPTERRGKSRIKYSVHTGPKTASFAIYISAGNYQNNVEYPTMTIDRCSESDSP